MKKTYNVSVGDVDGFSMEDFMANFMRETKIPVQLLIKPPGGINIHSGSISAESISLSLFERRFPFVETQEEMKHLLCLIIKMRTRILIKNYCA